MAGGSQEEADPDGEVTVTIRALGANPWCSTAATGSCGKKQRRGVERWRRIHEDKEKT